MNTVKLELELPFELYSKLKLLNNVNDYIVDILNLVSKDDIVLSSQLIEGYLSTRNEDMLISRDFESSDLENWN